jgi:hypothetical protein
VVVSSALATDESTTLSVLVESDEPLQLAKTRPAATNATRFRDFRLRIFLHLP